MSCTGCADDLDHCHGTLIAHADGGTECTTASCGDLDPARHATAATCADLADCQCADVPQPYLLTA